MKDLLCECCRQRQYEHWMRCEPYTQTTGDGVEILRYGVALCAECVADSRELRTCES